jgi:hypothetical protein
MIRSAHGNIVEAVQDDRQCTLQYIVEARIADRYSFDMWHSIIQILFTIYVACRFNETTAQKRASLFPYISFAWDTTIATLTVNPDLHIWVNNYFLKYWHARVNIFVLNVCSFMYSSGQKDFRYKSIPCKHPLVYLKKLPTLWCIISKHFRHRHLLQILVIFIWGLDPYSAKSRVCFQICFNECFFNILFISELLSIGQC